MINGLIKEQNEAIINEAKRFKKLTRLIVLGSRAMENQKHAQLLISSVGGLVIFIVLYFANILTNIKPIDHCYRQRW